MGSRCLRGAGLVLITWLIAVGCVAPGYVECDDGTVCPSGQVCTAVGCAGVEAVEACQGQPDETQCVTVFGQGRCQLGVCVASVCGNGRLDGGEACDDGNTVGGDGCSATCSSDEVCGNGLIDPGEACDCGSNDQPGGDECEGTFNGGAICRADCVLPRCGNGQLDGGEVCDDGNLVSGDGCAGSCASLETCGNGVADFAAGEQCDDGNLIDSDGCQHTCVVQRCGDGITDPSEVCDDGNLLSADGCSPDCASDESCGNAVVDFFAGEQCDDGNRLSGDGCHSRCVVEEPAWQQIGRPTQFTGPAVSAVYDGGRNRVIAMVTAAASETLLLEPTGWRVLTPKTAAPTRYNQAIAYDPVRRQLLLFGGFTSAGAVGETWVFDGNWRRLAPVHEPRPRYSAGMAWDAGRQRIVLVGGITDNDVLSDVWEWDGQDWTQHAAVFPGFNTEAVTLAYDPWRRMLVASGGSRTWGFDGQAWQALAISPASGFASQSRATFDPRRGSVVRFDPHTGVLWTLSAAGWDSVETTGYPRDQFGGALVANPAADELLMVVDASRDQVWRLNGSSWQIQTSAPRPNARASFAAAFDPFRGRLIVTRGTVASTPNDASTWEFDGVRWYENPAAGPSLRYGGFMGFDVAGQRSVLFGGKSGSNTFADTWEYDGVSWTAVDTATDPPGRVLSALTYDRDAQAVLMFGGWSGVDELDDLWSFDGTDWTLLSENTAIPDRLDHDMTYDPIAQRAVVFGGYGDGTGDLGDTWAWDGAAWTVAAPVSGAVDFPVMVFADRLGRIVRAGGWNVVDTFEYDGDRWFRTAPMPGSRSENRLVYDGVHGRVLSFGGETSTAPYVDGDVWEYRYRGDGPDEYCPSGRDLDQDGLAGCADPDCAGYCAPACDLAAGCADLPRCGDGVCSALEAPALCAADCGAPAPVCGDGYCDPPEDASACWIDCEAPAS